MRLAVNFHDEAMLVTIEVDDVIADLMLPSEFQTGELPVAQHHPEHFFRGSLAFAQFSGAFHES